MPRRTCKVRLSRKIHGGTDRKLVPWTLPLRPRSVGIQTALFWRDPDVQTGIGSPKTPSVGGMPIRHRFQSVRASGLSPVEITLKRHALIHVHIPIQAKTSAGSIPSCVSFAFLVMMLMMPFRHLSPTGLLPARAPPQSGRCPVKTGPGLPTKHPRKSGSIHFRSSRFNSVRSIGFSMF